MPNTPNQRSTRSNSASSCQVTLSDIKTLIETSKQEVMQKFEEVIAKQTVEIATLSKRIEELGKSNFHLQQKCKFLEDEVTSLSMNILEEVDDRSRRRKNLIFSGIPEQTTGSVEKRKETDMHQVEEILEELVSNMDEDDLLEVHRIGRPESGKCRILKVKFKDENDCLKVLKNARKLRDLPNRKGVYINPDLTVLQRRERKALTEELRRRRNEGEDVVILRGKVVAKSNVQNFR